MSKIKNFVTKSRDWHSLPKAKKHKKELEKQVNYLKSIGQDAHYYESELKFTNEWLRKYE